MDQFIDIGVGLLGNVDSSKSTSIGALVSGEADDGNGKLRNQVARHPHEVKSGKTSDISYRSGIFGKNRITFADLAGHEKYLKTTISGLNSFIPDLIMMCVDKYSSTYKMTKEHIGLTLRMEIPFIILMTKIDLYDKEITDVSLRLLRDLIMRASNRKFYEIKSLSDVDKAVANYVGMGFIPVFRISNVTLEGHPLLKEFLSRIVNVSGSFRHPKQFIVDRDYRIRGIGLVVCGFNGNEPISVGDHLWINGQIETVVKSIHDDFTNPIHTLPSGVRGCLNLRTSETRVKVGSALTRHKMDLFTKFSALVNILTSHSTTIKVGYMTYCHIGAIKIAVRVINENPIIVRGGDKTILMFETLYPIYIEPEQRFFFREGRVIGDGKIIEILPA